MEAKKIYMGLDLGTNSCGWAVTDENYNVIKKSGRHLHGVRKFEEQEKAEDRRIKRSNRRRLKRRKFRLEVLQDLFEEEIIKKDPNFFIRLNNSFFKVEDKPKGLGKYTIFNDKLFSDKEYYKQFKTIYHLRKYLMESKKKEDIRLIYLACHNILKYRGNFLMQGISLETKNNNDKDILDLFGVLNNQLNEFINSDDNKYTLKVNSKKLSKILEVINKEKSITNRVKEINKIINPNKSKENKKLIELIVGKKVQFKDLLFDDEYKNIEHPKVKFSEEKYENEIEPMLFDMIGEAAEAIHTAKKIYNWIVVRDLLQDNNYLSEAMVERYNRHHEDLVLLKKFIRNHFGKKEYNGMFRNKKIKNNYVAYVQTNLINNKKQTIKWEKCSYEDFLKNLRKLIKTFEEKFSIDIKLNERPEKLKDKEYQNYLILKEKIDNQTILPKQRISTNGVLPYQLHKQELERILDNAIKNYEFLNAKTDNLSGKDKIIQLMEFRIPYYIGPLNNYHKDDKESGFAWLKRKEQGRVYPWNFEKKVDINQSAENFITRMTRKCSYLKGKDVLPKNSLLYSEFRVLNELNKLQINGEPINSELKKKLINDVFKKYKKVSQKRITIYLKNEGLIASSNEIVLAGIDGDFKNSLSSYIDFNNIFDGIDESNDKLIEKIERIIFIKTVFEDNRMANKKIKEEYPNLDLDKLNAINRLTINGWGNLSKEFLQEEVYRVNDAGEPINIISIMRNENKNLQEALYDIRYNLIEKVNEINGFEEENKILSYEELMDEVYVSPGIKRSIWQALKIVDEVKKILGQPIDKFFVEVGRGGGTKGRRTSSRRKQIENIYKNAKIDKKLIDDLQKDLNKVEDHQLRGDKLFFYFLQLGRCMYTNNPIDLDKLSTNAYDIDHIIPQAYLKDDSLTNKVLVDRKANARKTDIYPIASEVSKKMYTFWKKLYDQELLTEEKFKRLTRTKDLTIEEKGAFLNRQLVFTHQAVKSFASILERTNKDSKVIYSKASNVSEFRQKFNLLKSRDINDFHHAHDAYLNIVVGNTYNTKFGYNAIYYLKKNKDYKDFTNTSKMFERDVKGAWRSDGSTIKKVKKSIDYKDILVTKMVIEKNDAFYNETIYPGDKDLFPLKENDNRYKNTEKYGGYKSLTISYFVVVEHKKNGKKEISMEGIPVLHNYKIKNNEMTIKEVLQNYHGLKDIKILIDKVKIGTLMKIDKTYAYLAGKSDSSLVLHNANQLYANQKFIDYIRLINKHEDLYDKNSKYLNNDEFVISYSKNDRPNLKLTKSRNIKIYDEIISKFKKGLYEGLTIGNYTDDLLNSRDKFISLNVRDQAHSLYELIKITKCNATLADLSLFMERASKKGTNRISKNLLKIKICIYDESITGFYRKLRWQNE